MGFIKFITREKKSDKCQLSNVALFVQNLYFGRDLVVDDEIGSSNVPMYLASQAYLRTVT